MFASLAILGALGLGGAGSVDSFCEKLAPPPSIGVWTRSLNQKQAVLLIHGFRYQFKEATVARAELRPWQTADNPFVKELAKIADVYAWAYGQNASIDTIVKDSALAGSIARLRALGYADIVLVGHSAGGLIARHFVEDYPSAGVTKVVQVCAPNGGTSWAEFYVPKSLKAFTECLTIEGRSMCLDQRAKANKRIPEKVQFVCVVARTKEKAATDGLVRCDCQWTPDLQKQGIPAITLIGHHREVVRDGKVAVKLADLIREPQPRWPADRVDQARREILGK